MEIDYNEKKESMSEGRENGFQLYPISANESGDGLPYAPINWPLPGDIWCWKVGKRVTSSGYHVDRYLYLPKRLREKGKVKKFASRLSVQQYISTYPGTDVDAFFNSFSWKIPSKDKSEIQGTSKERNNSSVPSEDTSENLVSSLPPGTALCKAGNKECDSLSEFGEPRSKFMFCDICCSEPRFCRSCCCILCSRTISSSHGGYDSIKCEAVVDGGLICGHIAHIDCSLRSYMAGTVAGIFSLDAEYYCRRCDKRTDLLPHATKLLQTCESIGSRHDIEKVLNLGARLLHGSNKVSAKMMSHRIGLAMEKLKRGMDLKDVWNVEDSIAITSGVLPSNGTHTIDSATYEEPTDFRLGSPQKVSANLDIKVESLKLENEFDLIVRAFRKSQRSERMIFEESLHEQKKYILNLYQALDTERRETARHTAYVADPNDLFQILERRVDQIKRELTKFKEMGEAANGFAKTSKEVLKEHFGFDI